LAGIREENDMKGIFTGGTTIVLILTATAASAQLGGSVGAGVGGTVGTGTAGSNVGTNLQTPAAGVAVGMEAAARQTQTTPEASGDLKRATRKSRRDVANTADGAASVAGRAAVQSNPEPRTPGGGS
jgi:hypothetical protein